MAALLLLAVAVILLLLLVDFLRKNYTGLPLPHLTAFPVVGNALQLFSNPEQAHQVLADVSARFGHNSWKFNIFGREVAVLTGKDPELLKRAFVANRNHPQDQKDVLNDVSAGIFNLDIGPHHLAVKKAFRPFLMTSKYQDTVSRVLNAHCQRMVDSLKAQDGKVIDVQAMTSRFMFDALADLTLGAKLNNDSNSLFQDWSRVLDWMPWSFSINNTPYWKIRDTPYHQAYVASRDKIRKWCTAEVQRLVGELDSDAREPTSIMDFYLRQPVPEHGELSANELVDVAINWMWGAFDSTKFTIAMGILEAWRNPEILSRVRNEFIQVVGKTGFPNAQQLERSESPLLTYYTMETLRLYPPFPFLIGELADDSLDIGGGVVLPPGTSICKLLGVSLRNKQVWGQDAESFSLERWAQHYASGTTADPPGFLLFGKGPRSCPGEKIAMFDVRLFLGVLLRDFEFEFTGKPGLKFEVSLSGTGMEAKVRVRK